MGQIVVGLDYGGTATGATVIDAESGAVLLEESIEVPSLADQGPHRAMQQLQIAYQQAVVAADGSTDDVIAIGLITPGPAKGDSTISRKGSSNLLHPGWAGFNSRNAIMELTGKPVFYTNDGNAAALHGYRKLYGDSKDHVLEALIQGTGLGGGRVDHGVLCTGYDGRAAEYGHICIPSWKLLEPGQPMPVCGCGNDGDAESWTTLTALRTNLLPWYLRNVTDHPLLKIRDAKKQAYEVRTLAEQGDELCRKLFALQARGIALTFYQLAMMSDADTYLIGGGICTTSDEFRRWYLGEVKRHLVLPGEMADYARLELMEDGDEAGARGAALYARDEVRK